jgi:UDP-glucose 4-epimerase
MMKPLSLVTGGAGFMGSHVAKHCLGRGQSVVVLDDLSGGFAENVPDGASFIEGSICDESLVRKLFEDYPFRYVYHLAAYAAEGLSHFIRKFNYTNNLIGSIHLINAAVRSERVERFVYSSSIAAYGRNQLPMTEALPPQPEDPYGISKFAVELDLRAAHEMFGLNYTIFRPHNVYGEGQNIGDPYRNVLGIFMNQIMKGEPMTVYGDGSQTRAFSHIDDVAPAITQCVELPESANEVFNIGADQPYSVLDLAHMVAEAFEVEPKIQFLPARNEVQHAYASHEKVNSVFGLHPTVPLKTGIHKMAEWAKRMGAKTTSPFTEIEVEKNLPPSWKKLTK